MRVGEGKGMFIQLCTLDQVLAASSIRVDKGSLELPLMALVNHNSCQTISLKRCVVHQQTVS